MNSKELDNLPTDLADLLAVEKARPAMPDVARERLSRRLGLGLPIAAGLGAAATGVGSAGRHPLDLATDPLAGSVATARTSGFLGLTRAARIGIATFALGGVTGALIHSGFDRYETKHEDRSRNRRESGTAQAPVAIAVATPPVMPAPPLVAPAPPILPAPIAATAEAPPAAEPVRHHSHASATSAAGSLSDDSKAGLDKKGEFARDLDLAAEGSLIEIARTALSRNQAEAALEALQRHAHKFPHGRLAEERESLWVQSLVKAGRDQEARDRGERFHRRFPSSIQSPAVDAALRNLP